jgi:hypothetical protein
MFFRPFGHVLEGDLGSDFSSFSTKVRRDRHDFMWIVVFSMYGIILLAYSLNVYMYSLSVFSVHVKTLLAFSETNFFDSFPVFFLMHICTGKLVKANYLKKKKNRVLSVRTY